MKKTEPRDFNVFCQQLVGRSNWLTSGLCQNVACAPWNMPAGLVKPADPHTFPNI